MHLHLNNTQDAFHVLIVLPPFLGPLVRDPSSSTYQSFADEDLSEEQQVYPMEKNICIWYSLLEQTKTQIRDMIDEGRSHISKMESTSYSHDRSNALS